MRRFLCGLAQAAALPFILGADDGAVARHLRHLHAARRARTTGFGAELSILLGVYVAINVGDGVVAIAAKWLILGRTKPGRYPLWGVYYFRWWLSQRLLGRSSTSNGCRARR